MCLCRAYAFISNTRPLYGANAQGIQAIVRVCYLRAGLFLPDEGASQRCHNALIHVRTYARARARAYVTCVKDLYFIPDEGVRPRAIRRLYMRVRMHVRVRMLFP